MTALLAGASIPIQVDIGFGDVVTPGTEELEFPTLLDHPRPRVLAYPAESVIAEKFQAMVALGVANSRMKDLTAVRIQGGFWSPLFPFALPQVWPFYWWIAVAEDMFSRNVMGFAVFKRPPTSRQVQELLGRALDKVKRAVGVKPKYFVTDKGKQFDCPDFAETWCEQHGITPRFGAVGKYGSIAVIQSSGRTSRGTDLRRALQPHAQVRGAVPDLGPLLARQDARGGAADRGALQQVQTQHGPHGPDARRGLLPGWVDDVVQTARRPGASH
jgi:transposase InsO family protein